MTTLNMVPLHIVCPAWCGVTQEEHREELLGPVPVWDPGYVHHRSDPSARVTVSMLRWADGSPRDGDQPPAVLLGDEDIYPATRDALEEVIRGLHAALEVLDGI